jgi:hypothetical protein
MKMTALCGGLRQLFIFGTRSHLTVFTFCRFVKGGILLLVSFEKSFARY